MPFLVILFLFLLGLLFGSFSSVIIERLKYGKKGIMTGRSECPNCKHLLGASDLFPLFSWLFLRGKCRYCKAPISPIYPLLELSMATLFALCWAYFIDITALINGQSIEVAKLTFALGVSFVTTIFVFYDIRFTEIPDEILIPAIFIVLALLWIDVFHSLPIFSYMAHFEDFPALDLGLWSGVAGALAVYSFFYLQILIPGLIYTIREKKYRLSAEIIFGYVGFFGWMVKYLFTWKNDDDEEDEEDAIPTWIGGGDLRIALFMGLVLGLKLVLIALFISYIVGSVVGITTMLYTRKRGQMIPFWPFLGTGLMVTLLWSSQILHFIEKLLTPGLL